MSSQFLYFLPLIVFAAFLLGLVVVLWPRPRDRMVRMAMKHAISNELSSTATLRGAALRGGPVQVVGTVEAVSTIRTPIWGVECVAYHVEILTPRTALRRKTGHIYKTEVTVLGPAHEETGAVPFDVIDETGRVRIQADSTVRLAMSSARVSSRGLLSRLTPDAQRYLDSVMDTLGGPLSLRESWVPPGAKCYVVGDGVPAAAGTPAQLVHGQRTILISE